MTRNQFIASLKGLTESDFGSLRTLLPNCSSQVDASGSVGPRVDRLIAWAESPVGDSLASVVAVAHELFPAVFPRHLDVPSRLPPAPQVSIWPLLGGVGIPALLIIIAIVVSMSRREPRIEWKQLSALGGSISVEPSVKAALRNWPGYEFKEDPEPPYVAYQAELMTGSLPLQIQLAGLWKDRVRIGFCSAEPMNRCVIDLVSQSVIIPDDIAARETETGERMVLVVFPLSREAQRAMITLPASAMIEMTVPPKSKPGVEK